jgi:hypothetical protein
MSTDELPPSIVDPASANAWADHVRKRVTPTLEDSEVRGPDYVIAELERISAAAGVMVVVVRDADVVRRDTARVLATARAHAQSVAAAEGGRVADKAAKVELAIAAEAEAADLAEIALEYAKSVARLVESRKSSVQTIGRMVEITYSLAGSRR